MKARSGSEPPGRLLQLWKSKFTQVLYLSTDLRCFTWVYPFYATLFFYSTTSQNQMLYFLQHYSLIVNTKAISVNKVRLKAFTHQGHDKYMTRKCKILACDYFASKLFILAAMRICNSCNSCSIKSMNSTTKRGNFGYILYYKVEKEKESSTASYRSWNSTTAGSGQFRMSMGGFEV